MLFSLAVPQVTSRFLWSNVSTVAICNYWLHRSALCLLLQTASTSFGTRHALGRRRPSLRLVLFCCVFPCCVLNHYQCCRALPKKGNYCSFLYKIWVFVKHFVACFRKLLHNYYYFYYCSLYKINQIKLLLFYLATESGQMYSKIFMLFMSGSMSGMVRARTFQNIYNVKLKSHLLYEKQSGGLIRSSDKDKRQKIALFWEGGTERRQQSMTHLWPALFGLVTRATCLSHLKLQCHDDLSSTDTTSQPLPRYRGELTQAMKVTKKGLVSWSASIWLKGEEKQSRLNSSCLQMTECVTCNSNYFNQFPFFFSTRSFLVRLMQNNSSSDPCNDCWCYGELLISSLVMNVRRKHKLQRELKSLVSFTLFLSVCWLSKHWNNGKSM